MSQATLWGLLAAVPAVLNEYLYKTLPGSWLSYLYVWVPSQMLIGYSIYRLVKTPGSLLDAFVIWAFATTALRIVITVFFLDDAIRPGTWVAMALIIAARIAQTCWGR